MTYVNPEFDPIYCVVLDALTKVIEGPDGPELDPRINIGGLIFEFSRVDAYTPLDGLALFELGATQTAYISRNVLSWKYGKKFIARIFTELICERLNSFDKEVTRFASQSEFAGSVEEGYGHGNPETTGGV